MKKNPEIQKIDKKLLADVIGEAQKRERKRANYNFHFTYDDPINRMLNAFEPGTYVQPHKHENPDKREVFLLLKGKLTMIFFNDLGEITEQVILHHSTGIYGVEVPPKVWHTVVSLESGTVVYEIKDGPYVQADDKNFASWAPKEGEAGCAEYLDKLIKELELM
ncbi:WbuC family cupin fold metalloprotein [Maribellus maritimus]|uniref:WbuC family cupin fold metalloprotein n=1 Tax=Maribellus maritimus TaxID=2870838 RepID=UPI001EEAE2AF|nr:WbuC family cupin fold metalloprotein [Maribellus maritimus]